MLWWEMLRAPAGERNRKASLRGRCLRRVAAACGLFVVTGSGCVPAVRVWSVVERDGVVFHADAIATAASIAARLLADHPDGITVSQLRDALGVTRKHALPMVSELDARGITRRRGDLRIGGPRLPTS